MSFVKHTACPKCTSSDGYADYGEGNGGHCFVCEFTVPSDDYKEEQAKKNGTKVKPKKDNMIQEKQEKTKPAVTAEQTADIKSKTSMQGNGYRGIDDATLKFYGARTEYNETNGEVQARYYPVTRDDVLVGWKVREVPKTFYAIGNTGNDCDLYGAFRFRNGGKYLLIVEGESDAKAAYQMFKEYSNSKNSDFVTAVVSITNGAGNPAKQLAANYEFISLFDTVVLGFDSDEPGKKAIDKAVSALPKGKVKICTWTKAKDPNEYLQKDMQKQFISDFYNAKAFTPDGIIASNNLSAQMREELMVPKIPLPPFMHKLQDMMAGGIPLGRILNLGSASGTGKSTILDEMIYYWLFNSPHLPGIVSLESSAGQYGLKLLSRHVSNKIELMSNDDALAFIDNEKIAAKEYELFNKEDGSPRFYLMDERDGGVDSLKDVVENLIISCGVKVVVLDPIQDILDGLAQDEQTMFLKWQKGMVKSHGCTFINVNHVRKNSGGQKANSTGADIHEEDFHGTSSIFKSGACNLLFTRNKEAEDNIEKNTTTMKASKIRWTGKTGQAGQYYYDNATHTMHDLDDWLKENGTSNF
jgi:archaellum biogenesis ATPase FlaH